MFSQILEMLKSCITAPFEWLSEMNNAIGFLTFLITMLFLSIFIPMIILGVRNASSDIKADNAKNSKRNKGV